jgi:Domain of unknown function (DUF6379)
MNNQPAPSENSLPAPIRAILAHAGKRRSFLRDEPVRHVSRHGVSGIHLAVNLTSYRSLPLSCIEGLLLKIDDLEMDVSRATLLLNGQEHQLSGLSALSHVWWFILDPGAFFVPMAQPLTSGKHRLEATLITVEPYITAGRFLFYHSDQRELMVEAWENEQ